MLVREQGLASVAPPRREHIQCLNESVQAHQERRSSCSGLHSSAGWLALMGLNRLTLAGIIGCIWFALRGFLATFDTVKEIDLGRAGWRAMPLLERA